MWRLCNRHTQTPTPTIVVHPPRTQSLLPKTPKKPLALAPLRYTTLSHHHTGTANDHSWLRAMRTHPNHHRARMDESKKGVHVRTQQGM
jgi:hypothetical protein